MHRKLILPLFLCLALPALPGYAQKANRFSGDSTKFITELNTAFENLPDNEKKMTATLLEGFMQKWNAEQYSPSMKKIIYRTCNEMARRKYLAFPDLYNYIRALDAFMNSHQPEPSFFDWSVILNKLVSNKVIRHFNQFVEMSVGLFGENVIYQSSSTQWKTGQNGFHFLSDSVPLIEFNTGNLCCYANNDSLVIYNTRGIYFPLTQRWVGTGGRVDWRRAGIDPGEVYADLHDYRLETRFSKFTADSVDFYYKKYFNYPLTGTFSDKVLADVTEDKASYPRFESFDKQIGIRNLFPEIDYLGGFSMEGARIMGTGAKGMTARLTFKKDGKEFVVVRSSVFVIHPDRINSGAASITLYHEDDSIYHPGLQMKYINEKRELTLSRDERVTTISPWFDSWHKIEIYCELLSWVMGQSTIDFKMMMGPNQEGKAVFESSNYYSEQRYDKMQGIDELNPLYVIQKFTEKKKSRSFEVNDLADYMQKPANQVEALLLRLAFRGFLIYDVETHTALIKDKLYNYVKAKNSLTDYDVIYFNSTVSGRSSGILDLLTFDLKVQGVPSVFLSDSQQVYIYPANQEVILKKDLDFVFTGKVEAGLFDFYAKDCSFEYGKFRLNMPEIDSMGFYIRGRTKDPKTQTYPLMKVKGYITGISGYLLIDDPKNKSGLKYFPDYPIFTSENESYVNWEKKEICQGVYKKDRFFYTVHPFTFKHIGRIATDSLQFSGFLTSAGIFPDIHQPLKVRPDYSLGIEAQTDTAGYPAYGGKGTFTNRIDMSNLGLHGDGRLAYLNSVSWSHDYIFYPDSMRTLARSFEAREQIAGVEYPSVTCDSVREFWLPNRDSLIVSTGKHDAVMFNRQSAFTGQLSLTPRGMTGDGTIKIADADMDSRQFKFKRRTFDANIANFRIRSYNLAELSISTKNYQTHFDFDKRRGEFKSNIGISRVEFPFNKYICSMDRFDWMIDNQEITLANEIRKNLEGVDTLSFEKLIGVDFSGSEFISVEPGQDSLRFFALRARYNLRSNVINAEDVRIIRVADAAVFPDSGKVCILKDAQMQTLRRAAIIANTTTMYHRFYGADVNITSRKKYTANGKYDYMDREGAKEQIRFSRIAVDTSGETVAKGSISDSAGFRLSPEFAYKGEVNLKASRKILDFDGGFRPVTDCFNSLFTFTQFESTIDPAGVKIPLTDPLREMNAEKLELGFVYSNTSSRVFPAFFSPWHSFSDTVMTPVHGVIDYSTAAGEYRISTEAKLQDPLETDNLLALNPVKCLLRSEGTINLALNAGPLNLETYGTMNYFVIPDSVNAQVAIALDFPFSSDALEKFAAQLNTVNLEGLIYASSPYAMAIRTILGRKEYEKVKAELEMYGRFKKFPDELSRTLFLADVHMHWDSVGKAWVSFGRIGIGNIQKTQVNRYVKGIIEFAKKRNGDDLTIYLELTPNDWYFFNYRNNILQAISSNLDFNDLILSAEKSHTEQKRVSKEARGFRYVISTDRKKRDFLRKFSPEE
ncbi:MAG TPA: hypothetical protein VMC08_06620 [Bacteroidales bacterium]|nr:hypothetical protein [Bacteroidales bacterium]